MRTALHALAQQRSGPGLPHVATGTLKVLPPMQAVHAPLCGTAWRGGFDGSSLGCSRQHALQLLLTDLRVCVCACTCGVHLPPFMDQSPKCHETINVPYMRACGEGRGTVSMQAVSAGPISKAVLPAFTLLIAAVIL